MFGSFWRDDGCFKALCKGFSDYLEGFHSLKNRPSDFTVYNTNALPSLAPLICTCPYNLLPYEVWRNPQRHTLKLNLKEEQLQLQDSALPTHGWGLYSWITNKTYSNQCAFSLCNLSSPSDVSPVDHKNEKLTSHHQSVLTGKYGKILHQFLSR